MAIIKLSKDATYDAKRIIRDTFLELEDNNKRLSYEIDSRLSHLNDLPSSKKYAELLVEISALMNQIHDNFTEVDEFCNKIIAWIDEYNSRWS